MMKPVVQEITGLLESAIAARQELFEPGHRNAFRLFNGFLEGYPDLVVDIYAATAVLFDHSQTPDQNELVIQQTVEVIRSRLPWLSAGILKKRNSASPEARRGSLVFGETPDRRVRENGVWYAVDLRMNQDASFYLDTRYLRGWARENLAGRSVLNAFAYTGSLGVAACAGGASRAVQLDLNRQFLNLAKTSYSLNGFPIRKADFIAGDFWPKISAFKKMGQRFDCVFLDPPFFSTTSKGMVDLAQDSARLINKVRPLINDGGWLVSVNNALYVSGQDYMHELERLCADGYLEVAALIPVPEDFTGYPATRKGMPVTDPTPFNHSTKIAVLKVRRKN
jgi:23S rRNA (cytosine1962-C5)-methyltransferase